jgi:predicted transcriptional regulator YheO
MNNLKMYSSFMDFMGQFLGSKTELILLDSEKIIHVVNPFHSSHVEGGPIDEIERRFISEKRWEKEDSVINYRSLTRDKIRLRAATYFFKDRETRDFIGMVTINTKVNELLDMRRTINMLINGFDSEDMKEHHEPEFIESLDNSFEDMMSSVIQLVVNTYNVPPDRLSPEEKLQIVKALDAKGTFLIKGSVTEVARVLNSSEATIYRYLNQLSN